MALGLVGLVVGPAAPQDADPAGADPTECSVVLLTAGACLLVGLANPWVLATGGEDSQSMAWRMRLLAA